MYLDFAEYWYDVSSFVSSVAARHFIGWLAPSAKGSAPIPGFEPGPQRIPKFNMQMHYRLEDIVLMQLPCPYWPVPKNSQIEASRLF